MIDIKQIGLWPIALAAAGLLAACAGISMVQADVSSYGDWPSGRQPGSYVFERLPSQQAGGEQQQMIEDAARPALARAGFSPAADAASAEYVVTVGARISRSAYAPWDDPLWLHGGYYGWRYPRYYGGISWRYVHATPRYEREVALLVRDRAGGAALHEARASSEGTSSASSELIAALFRAALTDFPKAGLNPRVVSVPLAAPAN